MNQFAIKCALVLLVGGFAAMRPVSLHGQVVVGSGSAALEIQSTTGGLLLPRLTTTERNNMSAPANGLTIYNTTTLCVEINHGTSSAPEWTQVQCRNGSISQLACGSSTLNGTLTRSQAASGVTITVPYTGGNGGVYSAISLASTGVTGLTATAAAGNLASGAGNLVLNISGTPASAGTATFALSLGGQTCSVSATVNNPAAAITQLDCAAATVNGLLFSGMATTATVSIPYTGGNSGTYSAQTLSSTGVTGLTATLSAGTVATGSGSITLTLSGTAATTGTASFALNLGGQSCTLNLTVTTVVCSAKVDATTFKNFYCYNLGSASTTVDPFTPSWEINGGYWQWGRTVQAAAGPTGPGSSQTNEGVVSGWNTSAAANGSWSDASKTANDPCPAGYRVPTSAQWTGVIANNTRTMLGTWSGSSTNYSAGTKFGDLLMLPSSGFRTFTNSGALVVRGLQGAYWSSTESSSNSIYMYTYNSGAATVADSRIQGVSVRCIADVAATVTTLNCAGTTVTGTLVSGASAGSVSASVPYTGGNGGFQNGQTVTSTGVTGLTATLTAGYVVSGSGSLTYTITGTPASTGTATFALNVGGQTCNLTATVVAPAVSALNCSSMTMSNIIQSGQAVSGVTVSVPYTGGNGGAFSSQTVTSTGVTGLTATLSAGNFAVGVGTLSYALTGTPSGSGAAVFALSIGGQSCNLSVQTGCGAFVAAGTWKEFSCYNLGSANTSADPLTPSWEINGGYWQWGRLAQAAAGPTGPGSSQTNETVNTWDNSLAASGSWIDSPKGNFDPCPTGFKVPSNAQWTGVIDYNTIGRVGTWSSSPTNYSAGIKFGNSLMLPAAGQRYYNSSPAGTLAFRGSRGVYWSSTALSVNTSADLSFNSTAVNTAGNDIWLHGFSVRCVAE